MTLTAIAGEDPNIAADEADRSLAAARVDRGRALGISTSNGSFVNKHSRRVIA